LKVTAATDAAYSIGSGLPLWADGAIPVVSDSVKLARSTAIHIIKPVTVMKPIAMPAMCQRFKGVRRL